MIDNKLMADIAYNNPRMPVSAIRLNSQPSTLNHFHRYHRIHSFVMMLAPHSTEAAEYLAEGLGADALHQAGIAVGEVLVDVGGAEQGGGFALTGQAVVAEEEFLHGLVTTETAVAQIGRAHV